MAGTAQANQAAIDRANEAVIALTIAIDDLEFAQERDDRVQALSEAIQALEIGMGGIRDGLRSLTVAERHIQASLDQQRDQISRLLGVLMTIERASSPLLLIHPTGPEGAARSGIMLSDVTPALQREAESLRLRLEELEIIRQAQENSEAVLKKSLASLIAARSELGEAISSRTDLPSRFLNDPIATQLLSESSETLAEFALALTKTDGFTQELPESGFDTRRGALALPVTGTVLRKYKEVDAAGVARPGIILSAPPLSLVRAPSNGTIRFSGPFLDYGKVIIIEPEADYLIVIAGLDEVYVNPGDILDQDAPLGLLGGSELGEDEILLEFSNPTGSLQSETLYVEIRQNGTTLDPLDWFQATKDTLE